MANNESKKLQCCWTSPWLVRLYTERAGRPIAIITGANIEAELAEVARRRGTSR